MWERLAGSRINFMKIQLKTAQSYRIIIQIKTLHTSKYICVLHEQQPRHISTQRKCIKMGKWLNKTTKPTTAATAAFKRAQMVIFHLSVRYFSSFAPCFAILYLYLFASVLCAHSRSVYYCLKIATYPWCAHKFKHKTEISSKNCVRMLMRDRMSSSKRKQQRAAVLSKSYMMLVLLFHFHHSLELGDMKSWPTKSAADDNIDGSDDGIGSGYNDANDNRCILSTYA